MVKRERYMEAEQNKNTENGREDCPNSLIYVILKPQCEKITGKINLTVKEAVFVRWNKNKGKRGRRKAALAGAGRARTAGFLKALRRRSLSAMLPAALAAVFFLAAAVSAFIYTDSPEKQAGRFIEELYTVNRYQGKDAALSEEIPGVYRRKFGGRMTDAGLEAAIGLGLPYGLLSRERPVDRTYAEVTEVTKVLDLTEQAGVSKEYAYKVLVQTHFIKDDEAVQPVTEETYTGTVRVKKSGWFFWRLDEITKSGG